MTQAILGLQAALITLIGFIAAGQLDFLADVPRGILGVVAGLVLAFIGPFLPKVSAAAREKLGLGVRRGSS